jgi:UPF0755 protein
VPEGLRVADIVDVLADKTDFSKAQFEKVLANPEGLGLPKYANGNAEGYLFPSTYDLGPKETPKSILRTMVARWEQAAEAADLEARAEELGYTPRELMIVASLVEAEAARDADRGKVARVIYNRLAENRTLEFDSTVNYPLDRIEVATTDGDRGQHTPWNTYVRPGLPATPICSPGQPALAAAEKPEPGDWLYFVTIDMQGTTLFTRDYPQHLANIELAMRNGVLDSSR